MTFPPLDLAEPGSASVRFPVTQGSVLDVRLLFRRLAATGSDIALGTAALSVSFRDARDRILDPRLANGEIVVDVPETVEVLPFGPLDDGTHAAGRAQWYLLAPPDAVEMRIGGWPDTVEMLSANIVESEIDWGGGLAKRAQGLQKQCETHRKRLIKRLFSETAEDVIALACDTGSAQMAALAKHFEPGGDWASTLSTIADNDLQDETRTRRDRLRAQAENIPRIGFIGSERGFERLSFLTDAVWLREAEYPDQLRYLGLETVVIEVASTGGASGDGGAWNQAFASLTGELPKRGEGFFQAAREAGVPVHLWATGSPETLPYWRGAKEAADRFVAEGTAEEWASASPDAVIRRSTEPAACSLAALNERQPDLMLVPTASDAYQFSDFQTLIDETTLYRAVLSEFRYNFAPSEFARHFSNGRIRVFGSVNRMLQRQLLQAARVVLLRATSLRPSAELTQIAIDAISSGAIPILYGDGGEESPLLSGLDRIHDAAALRRLLSLLRIGWFRERRLRALLRVVWRNHVWNAAERAAVLGRDPFDGAEFERPKITAVLVSKRPHLIARCLATFRKQSWQNKELVVVFNTGQVPEDLPNLHENERVFAMPEAANIGECLNMGIAAGSGRYWVKMDDDDYYSQYYLEDTAGYYRSAQADIVGRQSVFYYFSATGMFKSRDIIARRCFKLLNLPHEHISGATLSALRGSAITNFSQKDRNSCDSNWVQRNRFSDARLFSGDSTSMMVYRDVDETKHTWQISHTKEFMRSFVSRESDLFERVETV